jgi:hypothetical protein
MSVANVVMFEFETSADLENWAEWYKSDGPFPNNEISLFVKTGETSAFGIASYPTEEDRESGGKLRDALVNGDVPFKIKEIVPFGGPVLVEFIDGVLFPKRVK